MTDSRNACLVLAGVLILASCDPQGVEEVVPKGVEETVPSGAPGISEYAGSDADLDLVTGQTIFVPAYSEILHELRLRLSTSLAIHNAALSEPLVVQSVRHYDTDGNLVKEYVEQPLQLAPLATKVFEVERPSEGTGAGANFIVEWAAQKAIYEPVIEAVMVGSAGTHGFSLISPGRVMKQDE